MKSSRCCRAARVAAGEEEPQVLHGGADDHVVEVEHAERAVAQEQVARVQIAVDAVHVDAAQALVRDVRDGARGREVPPLDGRGDELALDSQPRSSRA